MRPFRTPGSESPTVEVVVFRHGHEIGRELCDTPEDAALAVERWSEEPGVVCQVDDLAVHHRPEDIRDPSPSDFDGDDEFVGEPPDAV
jgi:hypothetical protein